MQLRQFVFETPHIIWEVPTAHRRSPPIALPQLFQDKTITTGSRVRAHVKYLANLRAGGNTATNVSEPCKVENQAQLECPAFVNTGDLVGIDTRTGEYLEPVSE